MSKFCVKTDLIAHISVTALHLSPKLIHDNSVALLLIWRAGLGVWVGPGVNN